MANKSRFKIAESNIKTFFKSGPKIYTKAELIEIFEAKRNVWSLPASMTKERFVDRLVTNDIVKAKEIEFSGYVGKKIRYVVSEADVFEIALSIMKKSYLSHYTAAFLNGLTTQVPKIIYVTFEQSKKNKGFAELHQDSMDYAFSQPQRKSNSFAKLDGYTILAHNGMFSNRAGVYPMNLLPVTNIERTLIDITVRPDYAGGVNSVLEIYRNAISKISINKLLATLENLDFIYPYHQAIGFYLEKAGLPTDKIKSLIDKEKKFDFYLTYEIKNKAYDANWRIYYPKEM